MALRGGKKRYQVFKEINYLLPHICLIVIGSKVFVCQVVNAFQSSDAFVLVIYITAYTSAVPVSN